MILELAHPLWLDTPLGQARALFLIDRGPDANIEFVTVTHDGKIVTFSNEDVLVAKNYTMAVRADWKDFPSTGIARSSAARTGRKRR